MKCEFCNSEIGFETTKCKHCGAPCQFVKKPDENSDRNENTEKSVALTQKDHDDLRPMGSPDISFLKENQKEKEKNSSGCGIVILVIIVSIIIITLLVTIK